MKIKGNTTAATGGKPRPFRLCSKHMPPPLRIPLPASEMQRLAAGKAKMVIETHIPVFSDPQEA